MSQVVPGKQRIRLEKTAHVRSFFFLLAHDICLDLIAHPFFFRLATGTLEAASDVNTEVMYSILNGSYQDVYSNLFSTADGFHVEDQEEADRENFEAMKGYFNLCMNETHIDSLGPTPIYETVALFENELFPAGNNSNQNYTQDSVPHLARILTYLNQYGVDTINSISIDTDDKNPNYTVVSLSQASLSLPSKEYYEKADTIEKYRTGLKDLLSKVLGDSSNSTLNVEARAQEGRKVNFTLWTQEKVDQSVERFLAFESQLANFSLRSDEMQDPTKLYNPMNLTDFQAQNPTIDWAGILKALTPNDTSVPERIIIRTPEYFTKLNNLLSSQSVTLQTLQEYFVIQWVLARVDSLDSASRLASIRISGSITTGTFTEQPRQRVCTSSVSNNFKNTMGRYYTLKKFGGEKEIEKAMQFVDLIHQAWADRIPQIDWLDEQTRAKALEKLKLIKHKVALSIVSPDLRSPEAIKKYYEGLDTNQTSLYSADNHYSEFATRKVLETIGKPVDRDQWYMSAQTVNAYYSPNENEIVIPAGIMQTPMYSATQPDYLNYGAMGMIIGHEFSHGFDNSGRKFDGNGNLVDWWTNDTSSRFEEKTTCFINQYGKFNITSPDNKIVNVNGKLTLGENLADNGGVFASLSAYRKSLQMEASANSQQRLPGLEKFSQEALFFINFGRLWCKKLRPEVALRYILTDPHSPNVARVNGVAQNSEDFARVFNCPVGSPMNPSQKCMIW
ncbi:Membrane metallo-endopeptidase-like 1 [Choanephora cucurbitarum]|uniref:Membrane metallo-endopeptidase-like 1 n=1 Tax=Choanephora cucurbitarum TaxID=101091 RepID=A0A1C7NDB2_9FUNG|nr:Membrane metallo-endopeptidase-like 1 [Choanephora cucurbitarum]